jgi:DNA-binding protein
MPSEKEQKEAAKEPVTRERPPLEQNVILVGKKPTMTYALMGMLLFSRGINEVTVKARGAAISKAVDVTQVLKRRLLSDTVDIKEVKIGTEVLGEAENVRHVSTIEIVIGKA